MRAIINDGLIGTPRCVMVHHLKQHDGNLQENWKTDPAIGGGGLFVDMQSHTLDWLDHTFGKALQVSGHARSQSGAYRAEDTVSFSIGYDPVVATGFCCYAAGQNEEHVKVFGSHGSVRMSFFAPSPILVDQGGVRTVHDVKDPAHVHQPFVERVIHHLLDGAPNPCPPDAARRSSAIIETLLSGVA